MRKTALWAATAAFSIWWTGCTTTDNTNLTPRRVARDPNGQYHFETTWQSNHRGVGTNVQAYVMVDTQLYPMQQVPMTKNRFEAFVPLPPGKTYIPYRYRYDFEYLGSFQRARGSDLSPSYRLIVPLDAASPIESNQPKPN